MHNFYRNHNKDVNEFPLTVQTPQQTVHLTVSGHRSIRQELDRCELRVRAACGGLGACGACLIQVISGEFNPPTAIEYQKIPHEDLLLNLRLACQLWPQSAGVLFLENPAPKSEWKSMLEGELLCGVQPDHRIDQHIYGIALDLGTTHIRLSVWDRRAGRRIGCRYSINPQIVEGADVLTRLEQSNQGGAPLTAMVRKAVIEGVRDILSRDLGEISSILADVGKIVIVGNTAMLTLICGQSNEQLFIPENWQQSIACYPVDLETWRHFWRVPSATIEIMQPLAGFVGSDLIADILATGLLEQGKPMLLADFGTNTEIVVWDGEVLRVSSVPGGPAYEGMGLRNGMSAEKGAIYRVVNSVDMWELHTLGDEPARGFCGSGFIDAIAGLLSNKRLKSSGRFNVSGQTSVCFLDSENLRTGIYASDIDVFQRAKAATAAAMLLLLDYSGLRIKDLDCMWVCGNFGRHLNIENAIAVGLLPGMAPNRFRLLTDAGLKGCEMRLLQAEASQTILERILKSAQVFNFGGVLEYENRFVDCLRLQPMLSMEDIQ